MTEPAIDAYCAVSMVPLVRHWTVLSRVYGRITTALGPYAKNTPHHVVGALHGWDGVSHTLYRVINDRPLGTGQGASTQRVGDSLAFTRRPSERESIIQGIHSNLEETVGEVL